MKARHTTPSQNAMSMLQKGPGPVDAVTPSDKTDVWLHTTRRTPWAIRHTSRRKRVSEDEMVILEVSVLRAWLSRAWPGVWMCPKVIPPERLRVLAETAEG